MQISTVQQIVDEGGEMSVGTTRHFRVSIRDANTFGLDSRIRLAIEWSNPGVVVDVRIGGSGNDYVHVERTG